ncbi:MAG: [FeFe] hydrogenase H-cluster radical SAM maturase HydG [Deferribacteraceae bacterium]|jgi:2-iminoacetate synthase|nr:[FeFe] hydrogenase H-cluster radical SAM maturase HydG [Deferribacteraceae bacterium]
MRTESFINEAVIWETLEKERAPSPERVNDILAKAAEAKGLDMNETAALLAAMSEEQEQLLFETALKVKEAIYGKRMVLFAPLYVSNECSNSCAYCAFNISNKDLVRRSLNSEELAQEVRILLDMGHKRILTVYSEHPKWNANAIAESVRLIYSVKQRSGTNSSEIRRVNVNSAPLDVDGFKTLRDAGIGTYQCFQETYNRECYERVHTGGKKRDFLWRLLAMHRAQEAGIDDVGLGVLFGLFDYRFELLGLLAHALDMEKEYGVGPHTISAPRIEPAQNSSLSENPPYAVTDDEFKRIVALIRLAMPYTGMIITTREKPKLKSELLRIGISQLSAASRTYPGGYADTSANKPSEQQFWVGDERSLAQVIQELVTDNFIPSFCTSCYRLGRTGDHFMGFAKTAFIKEFCLPNAITTFAEYLADYAPDELRRSGEAAIAAQIAEIDNNDRRDILSDRLRQIACGQRDIYC